MRGLLISTDFDNKILDGGEFINKRNFLILKECCDEIDILKTRKKSNKSIKRKINTFWEIFRYNSFYGLSVDLKNKILYLLKKQKYDFCFISQSLGGDLASFIKKNIKDVRVIVFFHNVEYDFYKQLAENSSKYKYILAWNAKFNERQAIKYADDIIALNNRDAKRIEELYGRKVDLIFPTTFDDINKDDINKDDINKDDINKDDVNKNLLFVGSNFYANKQGIDWFINNVYIELQHINLYIVGKGTEAWKWEYKDFENIKIMGSVNDLKKYYRLADIVILPIFLGSGMKTKTAEALMYGKNILGTKEAFEGYDIDFDKVGGECNTKEEFIENIEKILKEKRKYNAYSRNIFLEKYSNDVWVKNIKNFLNK